MTGSRIWLDLSELFSCVQKKSCIYIDHDKLKTVKDVEDHIRRVFSIVSQFHIFNDGWLLPPSENSLILRDNDTISIVSADDLQALQSGITTESSFPVKSVAPKPEMKDRQGNSAAPCEASVTNGHNPTNTIENITVCVQTRNPFASPLSSDTIRKVSVKDHVNDKNLSDDAFTNGITQASQAEDDTNSEIGSTDRKRRRHRRKKKRSSPDTDGEPKPKEIKVSRYHANKLLQGVGHLLSSSVQDIKRKHIFFQEDSGKRMDHPEAEAVTKVENNEGSQVHPFHSSSEALSAEAHKSYSVVPPVNTPSPTTEGGLSKLLSLGNQKAPAVFERKKPDILKNNDISVNVPKSSPLTMKLTPLQSLPVKESIIKFKILKMCNYSPVLSETITARVISPDSTTNQIYVQIKEGLSELQSEKGKFSLEEDDDSTPSEYVLLNWHDLLEPSALEYC